MPHKLGIGILGYGRFADKWLRTAIPNSRLAELVAIQVRSRAVELPGISVYSEINDFLRDPRMEAVYVTSPNNLHAEHVCQSLAAGKHVLCEKPMAITVAQGKRMLAAAQRSQRYLAIGHMLRFSPSLLRAQDVIQSQSIGRFLYASADFSYLMNPSLRSWSEDKSIAGGGALLDAGIHSLDSLRFLLKMEPLTVRACQIYPHAQRKVEKSAVAILEFSHGTFAQVSVHAQAAYGSSLDIVGTQGRLRIEGFVRCKGDASFTLQRDVGPKTSLVQETISVSGTYERQIDAFCQAARENPKDIKNAENGLKNIGIVQALYKRSIE